MRTLRGLRVAIVIGVAVALAGSIAAYAYFTSKGSGEGHATVGTASPTVKIASTVEGQLSPGGTPAKVKLTIKNEGSSSTHVQEVTLVKVTSNKPGCVVSAFTMAAVTVNKTLTPSGETSAEGELKMANTEANQNECQGAELTLTFESD